MTTAVGTMNSNICLIDDSQLEDINGGEMSTGAKIAVATAVGLGCGGAVILGVFVVAVAVGYLANK